MVELLPRGFRNTSTQTIASYSYLDTLNGTGIVTFFAAKDEAGYILTPNQVYSDVVMSGTSGVVGSDTVVADLDFDVLFNVPQSIRGDVVVNVPWLTRNNAGTSQNHELYSKIYVRKVAVGGAETTIATTTHATLALTIAANTTRTGYFNISTTVSETTFNVGEKLRITVEHHSWNGGATAFHYVGHDPRNRATDAIAQAISTNLTFGTDPTLMIINVPFVVNT